MRIFILRSLALALIFTLCLGTFNFFIGWKLKEGIEYRGVNDLEFCVLGHSHPECAFNDSLIDGMKNFALSGEAYFYNYYKLESMLSKGVRPKIVFIEYSNNSLSADVCEWIWDDQNLSRSYVRFSPYIDLSGNALIAWHNPKGWLNAFCLSMKWRMDQLFKTSTNYLDYSGGYKFLERNELDSLMRTIEKGEASAYGNMPMDVCDMNRIYLRKMIQLLKDNDCNVYLMRSPLHRLYPGYKFEMAYDSIYKHYFSDVEKLDFSKFPLTNDDYVDFEHLNHKGARKFSIAFNDMIVKGLLSRPNKQQFIDEYFADELFDKGEASLSPSSR